MGWSDFFFFVLFSSFLKFLSISIGAPGKLIRERYRTASQVIKNKV